MGRLYYSKGLSKKAIAVQIVLIALIIIISFALILISETKVKGPTQNIYLNGQIQQITTERYKYSSSQRDAIMAVSYLLLASAGVDAVVLILKQRSWTEIYPDSIKANSMGKTCACKIAEISQVSLSTNGVRVVTASGKFSLIAQNPTEMHTILEEQLLNKY